MTSFFQSLGGFFTDFNFKIIDILFKMTDFRVTDHLLNNDHDDEYEGNTTTPFQPDYNSTSGPSGEVTPMTTMNRDKRKGQKQLTYLSLEVILLIRESSLQMRRLGIAFQNLSQQKFQTLRFPIVK